VTPLFLANGYIVLIVMTVNRIHPTAIVESSVEMGSGNTIGPYSVILGNCVIGDDNYFGPHVVIGTPGEIRNASHPATWAGDADNSTTSIGNRNVVREFVTVQSGVTSGTRIGNDCYIMTKSHIPHDGQLEDNVTVSCSVMIGGHSVIQSGATIGLGSVIHQKLVVGALAMIGMGSVVTRDIPPFALVYGNPATIKGGNLVGMRRAGLEQLRIDQISSLLKENKLINMAQLAPAEYTNFTTACNLLAGDVSQ
jgi:UDP-N-acetylglucosamine acyltransferase